MTKRTRRGTRRQKDGGLIGEFHLRGQNSRLAPLQLRWHSHESLYYGGELTVLEGPVGLKSRFENRFADRSWLKTDPDRIAGGRPFTESFFATVAFLMAFADVERVVLECVESPVPRTGSDAADHVTYREIEEFDRSDPAREGFEAAERDVPPGKLRAG